MPVKKKDDWAVVRVPVDVMKLAEKLAGELGFDSAQRVLWQCASQCMALVDVSPGERRFPVLVRAIDGVRSEGRFTAEQEPAPVAQRGGGTGVLKVGKG